MHEEQIIYRPIGWIHSPHHQAKGAPIQPSGAREVAGWVELQPRFIPALKDLDGFSHLILIYHFHRCRQYQPEVRPFLDQQTHGLFATRAPARPNPIGISVVRLRGIRENRLDILDVDILDGTPLLDLKPLVPRFDLPQGQVRTGWLDQKAPAVESFKGDERFLDGKEED